MTPSSKRSSRSCLISSSETLSTKLRLARASSFSRWRNIGQKGLRLKTTASLACQQVKVNIPLGTTWATREISYTASVLTCFKSLFLLIKFYFWTCTDFQYLWSQPWIYTWETAVFGTFHISFISYPIFICIFQESSVGVSYSIWCWKTFITDSSAGSAVLCAGLAVKESNSHGKHNEPLIQEFVLEETSPNSKVLNVLSVHYVFWLD